MKKGFQNFLLIALSLLLLATIAYSAKMASQSYVSLKETKTREKIAVREIEKMKDDLNYLNLTMDKIEKTFTEEPDSVEKGLDSTRGSLKEISSSLP